MNKMFFITMSSYYNDNSDINFKLQQIDRIADAVKDHLDQHELCGEFLHKFTLLGNPETSNNIWVLIGIYHETSDVVAVLKGEYQNDITALIFANSLEEAKELLKTHPVYLKDVEETVNNTDVDRKQEEINEIRQMDVLNYIFGDTGNTLAQLCGNFSQVATEHVELIKEIVKNQDVDSLKELVKWQRITQKEEIEKIQNEYNQEQQQKMFQEHEARRIREQQEKLAYEERQLRAEEDAKRYQKAYYLEQQELTRRDEEQFRLYLQKMKENK
jgi:hypothetical protein